ncbi:hypothetical protein D0869_01384 [Hortaea werneckii]|uniref:Uncharacterized protein n=1 Tax=Hortaea werneckii TaxID=91943 RepID=A0A3M6ZHK3_HORWE|nr:hypothetical protein KC324_g2411 [Hortaea werneckii]KAI7574146.1 hypothetical protein KC316_g11586 [Hortaea werneckii]RMX88760.1 hypothetical protein D0869_01384 [Hortaea werneckii]RMY14748.1 hypothetical protein D0868_01275 [Hortaea werneckii]
MANPFNKLPDNAPDGPLDENKGLLSAVGDPLGQVLDKGLRPIGQVTGAIGRPSGEAAMGLKEQAKEEAGHKDKEEKPGGERIGGNPQTGQNPLGL